MALDRRGFLTGAGVALAAGTASGAAAQQPVPTATPAPSSGVSSLASNWDEVRRQFNVAPDYVHMSAMLVASHPKPVRDTIDFYRRALDNQPVTFLEDNNRRLQNAAREAAGRYLGISGKDVALTDSTTMGVALVYNGLRLRPGDEILTTDQDYYVTHESLRHASAKNHAIVRRISLYEDIAQVSPHQIAGRIVSAITPRTRVLALTWVHSSTGLKLPLRRVTDEVRRINAGRSETEQIITVVDGVHGFGNQNVTFPELGCDFLIAGCHKWLFGPRGTGIIAATERGWRAVGATIPSFIDSGSWAAWINNAPTAPPSTGAYMSPGGFKAFEHLWSLTPAFGFHERIGKARVAARTNELADYLKMGLAGMPHVRLMTPRSSELSAGIVSFDVNGLSANQVVERLRQRRVIASAAPYAVQHVRLTPSIMNTPEEVYAALREVHALA